MMSFTCCWLNIDSSPSVGQQYVDLAKSRRRAAVTNRVHLSRFAFTIARRAELLPVALPGDTVAGVPEVRSSGLIRHARKHAALLAAFNLPEGIAAELKIVALLVDGETAVALNEDAVVDARNQIARSYRRDAGREPHVGHALERNAGPGIRIAAAPRFLLTHQMGLIANGLIVLEHALLDDRKLSGENPVIVILHRRESAVVGTVSEHVEQLAAEGKISHFLGGQETRARVIRFISKRPVQLSRVA